MQLPGGLAEGVTNRCSWAVIVKQSWGLGEQATALQRTGLMPRRRPEGTAGLEDKAQQSVEQPGGRRGGFTGSIVEGSEGLATFANHQDTGQALSRVQT